MAKEFMHVETLEHYVFQQELLLAIIFNNNNIIVAIFAVVTNASWPFPKLPVFSFPSEPSLVIAKW